jgi:hypothetical protein
MENEIAFLKTEEGLEFKLTSDKLFITGATGTEAFALRSINGIGVVDLVDKFNDDLTKFKKQKQGFKILLISSIVFLIVGLISVFDSSQSDSAITVISLGAAGVAFSLYQMKKTLEPQMMSVVRIMLNGMNRDFEFNKRKVNSTDVANFVARVEDTLTAFHKA